MSKVAPFRVTLNKLKELIQNEAKRIELEVSITELKRTRFRGSDYENGACFYYVYTSSPHCTFLIFYPLHVIQQLINDGYKISFKMTGWHGNILSDEIDFKKAL